MESYTPRVTPLPPGEFVISEKAAGRCERLLREMGWFIRTFEAKYGAAKAEAHFYTSANLSLWLKCASCYVHGFGNEVRGGQQLYFEKQTHKPVVGEFFLMWGYACEVVAVTETVKGVVTKFEYRPYPRVGWEPGAAMILMQNGDWREESPKGLERFLLMPDIKWGEFRIGVSHMSRGY